MVSKTKRVLAVILTGMMAAAALTIRNSAFLAAVDDAVVNMLFLDELADRTVVADSVDGIEMVVMTIRLILTCVDVLAESGLEISALKVMCSKSVSCKNSMSVSCLYDLGEGLAGIMVKCECRTHDPNDLAMIMLMAKQLIKFVVVLGE